MTVKQILLTIFLHVFPLFSFATDYYIATINLNVRTGAGQGYNVFFTLQKGDEVELISKVNNWYKITNSGKVGFAYSKYLKYSRTTSDTSVQASQEVTEFTFNGIYIFLALIIVFFLFWKRNFKQALKSNPKLERGTSSERDLVFKFSKYGIPEQRIFHDLYLEISKGHFSQIDLVVITEVGIIVIEVKDYSGWIFGRGNQSQWTQVLNYGNQKYRFYNPIMQNNKHISELKKQIPLLYNIPIYSLVVFYGNCELKEINFIPNGTFIIKSHRVLEVLNNILRDNKPVEYTNEEEMVCVLREAVSHGGVIENQIQHSENIKDMLGKHRIFD